MINQFLVLLQIAIFTPILTSYAQTTPAQITSSTSNTDLIKLYGEITNLNAGLKSDESKQVVKLINIRRETVLNINAGMLRDLDQKKIDELGITGLQVEFLLQEANLSHESVSKRIEFQHISNDLYNVIIQSKVGSRLRTDYRDTVNLNHYASIQQLVNTLQNRSPVISVELNHIFRKKLVTLGKVLFAVGIASSALTLVQLFTLHPSKRPWPIRYTYKIIQPHKSSQSIPPLAGLALNTGLLTLGIRLISCNE